MIAQMMMMQQFFNMNQQNHSNMSNMQANMKLMENQTKMRDLMKSMDDSSRKMGKNQQSGSQGSRTESSPNSSSKNSPEKENELMAKIKHVTNQNYDRDAYERNYCKNRASTPPRSPDSYNGVRASPKTAERLNQEVEDVNLTQKIVERLSLGVDVNRKELKLPEHARFFIIKSFTEEDVHRAVKYKLWCSTYYGNRRLESAYDAIKKENKDGCIYLFFSVNASGHFCGVAKMV